MLTAKIEGHELVIRLPLNPTPLPSGTGKNLVVASSHGNKQTEAKVNGKPAVIGVNAYIGRRNRGSVQRRSQWGWVMPATMPT